MSPMIIAAYAALVPVVALIMLGLIKLIEWLTKDFSTLGLPTPAVPPSHGAYQGFLDHARPRRESAVQSKQGNQGGF